MAKFGEIITSDKAVLILFYLNVNHQDNNTLQDVVTVLGEKVKVIKIDITKNSLLANALKLNNSTTFMIYKDGKMKWKGINSKTTIELLKELQQYL